MLSTRALQDLTAGWTLAELQTTCSEAMADERDALTRAWLVTHRDAAALTLFPAETRYGDAALSRSRMVQRFASLPRAQPGRAPWRACFEMYRGCGKTAKTRLEVLLLLIAGWELGALFVNRTADMATPHSRALQGLLVPRTAKSTRNFDRSPLGQLYPGLCYSGAVQEWVLHVPALPGLSDEPHDAPVYAMGIGGNLRGFLNSFTRPTMAIFDDVETADSARSPTEREATWRAITEEAAGIAPEDIGLASVMLCNALAPEDAGQRAEQDPGWMHDRVGVWTRPPVETGLVRELEAIWHATPGAPEAKDAAVAAHPRAAEVEALAEMTDPDRTVLWALCTRWSSGRRPFARNLECLRTSHGERTFDLDKVALCNLGREVERLGKDPGKVPLGLLRVAIWLDPRFSKAGPKNDFAAVVAVGIDPQGRRYTLDASLERDRGTASRARVWAMLDKLVALGADPRKIQIGFETNGGSDGTYTETFDEDIKVRRAANLLALTPQGLYSGSDRSKLDRIETMEDPLHGGRWYVAQHLVGSELWSQLGAVPHGTHDDGPDAMERADNLLGPNPPTPEQAAAARTAFQKLNRGL